MMFFFTSFAASTAFGHQAFLQLDNDAIALKQGAGAHQLEAPPSEQLEAPLSEQLKKSLSELTKSVNVVIDDERAKEKTTSKVEELSQAPKFTFGNSDDVRANLIYLETLKKGKNPNIALLIKQADQIKSTAQKLKLSSPFGNSINPIKDYAIAAPVAPVALEKGGGAKQLETSLKQLTWLVDDQVIPDEWQKEQTAGELGELLQARLLDFPQIQIKVENLKTLKGKEDKNIDLLISEVDQIKLTAQEL